MRPSFTRVFLLPLLCAGTLVGCQDVDRAAAGPDARVRPAPLEAYADSLRHAAGDTALLSLLGDLARAATPAPDSAALFAAVSSQAFSDQPLPAPSPHPVTRRRRPTAQVPPAPPSVAPALPSGAGSARVDGAQEDANAEGTLFESAAPEAFAGTAQVHASVTLNTTTCAGEAPPGSRVRGTLRHNILLDGTVIVPAGASVVFRVEATDAVNRGPIRLVPVAAIVRGDALPLVGHAVAVALRPLADPGRARALGGAVVGAAAGVAVGHQVADGATGTLLGGALGAAVGHGVARAAAPQRWCVPAGTAVEVDGLLGEAPHSAASGSVVRRLSPQPAPNAVRRA